MRGKHGPIVSFDKITERLLDRAEYEIERYCLAVGVRFNDLAAAYAGAATERFGSVLHGSQQWGVRDHVQAMRVEAIQVHQVELPALEGSRHPQNAGSALEASAQVQGDRGEEVKRKKPRINSWAKFNTPEKRRKEALRRMSMRNDPMADRMTGGKHPKKKDKAAKELQNLYLARSKAKRLGQPMPPLPSEHRLAPDEKRARDAERHRIKRAAAKKAVEAKARRVAKSASAVQAALEGLKGKHGGSKPRFTKEQREAKQKVYRERFAAKKKGEPIPPLPETLAASPVN